MIFVRGRSVWELFDERLADPISREVRSENLTYLSCRSLRNIERCLRQVRNRDIPGICLEAGVALGGSAVVIATLMPQDRDFHGYDVFGQIPPPGEQDGLKANERYRVIASGESRGIRGDDYYGYQPNLYERVAATLRKYGVEKNGKRVFLHKGLFEDTLELSGKRVAFVHLDCDWYEPIKLCLSRIYPVLSRGGFIISDDYHNYEGATKAVDEFLATHRDMRKVTSVRRPDRTTSLVLTKT
jgi:asparagine synthase (glutamine-hydrolysing)